MNNRYYNIFFHTHTISGIIISAVLYVIFFAGSFSFFRDEINNWERNQSTSRKLPKDVNFDTVLDGIKSKYNLYGRDITINWPSVENRVNVSLSASKDTLASVAQKRGAFFYVDIDTYESSSYEESYALGEFLYRLHFLAQIPYPIGYYLSGFTAFFFLFAIITGVLVHWKKIISSFYVFRPFSKLKTMWTDAHTSLGVIGLPFQFVYAVTGSFFMIKALVIAPSVMILYNGNQNKLYEDLEYTIPTMPLEYQKTNSFVSVNMLLNSTKSIWKNFNPTGLKVLNYGDKTMKVLVEGETDYNHKFTGKGKVLYNGITGKMLSTKDPYKETTYLDGVKNVLYRLHYGDYGGYALKLISMVLGFVSCFVIISGVMIWLVARDKKHIPEHKKRFNSILVRLYLAICLSMYPTTALTFLMVKINGTSGKEFLYPFYFITWLVLSLFFILKKDNVLTNKLTLLLGSILGILIPIANGIFSGNWFWKTFIEGRHDIFIVDMLWVSISLVGFYIYFQIKKRELND
ncbi:PepSY-associated TM helix domain-containing protein [Polaribacter cellanae]|uniref:PepSY domain-containing protein n=1 Tax=Polaribacter cellanae TaxID=2818493 RepID=A0A975CN03_9FLAO|nr:PepSY-associated TM helix domain-containing protein [Polaribacter cellanae]QTE22613.1 PepSY domain-containing protein [Polaribacter cellanae]